MWPAVKSFSNWWQKIVIEKLQEIAKSHEESGVGITITVAEGDPATEIVKQVIGEGHDLIISLSTGRPLATRHRDLAALGFSVHIPTLSCSVSTSSN